MDAKLVSQLRKSQQESEALEQRLFSSLEEEGSRISELKVELETRSKNRDQMIVELLKLGFRQNKIAKAAHVTESYIPYIKNRDM